MKSIVTVAGAVNIALLASGSPAFADSVPAVGRSGRENLTHLWFHIVQREKYYTQHNCTCYSILLDSSLPYAFIGYLLDFIIKNLHYEYEEVQ